MHKIRPDVAAIVAYEIITIRLTLGGGGGGGVISYLPGRLLQLGTSNYLRVVGVREG